MLPPANPLRTYYCHQESQANIPQVKERGPAKKKKERKSIYLYMCVGGVVHLRAHSYQVIFKDLLTLPTVTGNCICFCLRKKASTIFCFWFLHTTFRCFKGGYFPFLRCKSQGEKIHHRQHQSLWNPFIFHYSCIFCCCYTNTFTRTPLSPSPDNSTGGLSWLNRTSLAPLQGLPAEWRLSHSGKNQRIREQTGTLLLPSQKTKSEEKGHHHRNTWALEKGIIHRCLTGSGAKT